MPRTALSHFKEDVARARAIVAHANPLPQTSEAERLLRSDLFRSAWMFAVGALDAYFCDAYTDVVAATIISKSRYAAMTLPPFFNRIEFPVRAILESYSRNTNWRWRMAPREMMARENVLKLDRIRELFNGFCRDGRPQKSSRSHRSQSRHSAKRAISPDSGCLVRSARSRGVAASVLSAKFGTPQTSSG
jgi:hypothetical protein